MLASSISPEQCTKVLCPIVQTAEYPINLAAIKMQTKVIDRLSKDGLRQMLPEIIPGLIQVGSFPSLTQDSTAPCGWCHGMTIVLDGGVWREHTRDSPFLPGI